MANARKPDHVHKAQGTLQKVRHGDPNKKLTFENVAKPPRAPSILGAVGKRAWRKVALLLINQGVFTDADHYILKSFCQAEELLDAKWRADIAVQHRLLAGELGLSIASRSKIQTGISDKQNRNGPRAI